jgi:hypothetical protein
MRRYNLLDSFLGDPNPQMEGMAAQDASQDAVELAVKGGKMTILVPHAVSDSDVLKSDFLGGRTPWEIELELEGGMRLTLWLPDGPTCADLRWQAK